VIRHGEEFETLYGHLSRLVVKEGQEIRRGQVIGFSGNTGRSSNPHLHYEVIQDGRKVDPEKFFHIDG
jgi:murein DD-endopeptidase MepM/ murein hydrolase activator NlpD